MRCPNQLQRGWPCPPLIILKNARAQLQNRRADRDVHDMQMYSVCGTAVRAVDEMIELDQMSPLAFPTGNGMRPHEHNSTKRAQLAQNNGDKLDTLKLVPVIGARPLIVWHLLSAAAAAIGHTTKHTCMDCGTIFVGRLKTPDPMGTHWARHCAPYNFLEHNVGVIVAIARWRIYN